MVLRYNTADEAQAAKATLNGADLCGSSIVVDSWEKGLAPGGFCGISGGNFHQGTLFWGESNNPHLWRIWNNFGGIFFTYKQCRYVVCFFLMMLNRCLNTNAKQQTHTKKNHGNSSRQHNDSLGVFFVRQVKRLEARFGGVF